MIIVNFEKKHIEEARQLAEANYREEQEHSPILPYTESFPSVECFADNGLGVAMTEEGRLIGFLCCLNPWNNAFRSLAKGTFSPIFAHGAVKENRKSIYKRLYQAAAEKWISHQISYHAICLYAHESEAKEAFFTFGFGLRCMDAIRTMEYIKCCTTPEIRYEELETTNMIQVRELRRMLEEHMGKSPCFMYSSPEDFKTWIIEREQNGSRVFIAKDADKVIAFAEISEEAETFVSELENVCNICGAYCNSEYRGKDIYPNLLNFIIAQLKREGYQYLGVDFESINPTAHAFWLKHFTPYTNSVVRRIDECAL